MCKDNLIEQTRNKQGRVTPSLSVGVAFSDRKNKEDEIFKDADKVFLSRGRERTRRISHLLKTSNG